MREPAVFCADSTSAKARASLTAFMFCHGLDFEKMILERDAKLVVDAVNKLQKNFTKFEHIAEKIKLTHMIKLFDRFAILGGNLSKWHICLQKIPY